MTELAPRPYSALGYPPANSEGPHDASLAEDLVFVLDAQRFSKWAPSGLSVRHCGLHLAINAKGTEGLVSVLVSRSQDAAETSLELERHASVEQALAWVNGLAYSTASDYAPSRRPNALDVTPQHWDQALAAHPDNPTGWDPAERLLDERLSGATDRFLALYERYGGWRYHGRPDATDPAGYAGPVFWQEEDVRFRRRRRRPSAQLTVEHRCSCPATAQPTRRSLVRTPPNHSAALARRRDRPRPPSWALRAS